MIDLISMAGGMVMGVDTGGLTGTDGDIVSGIALTKEFMASAMPDFGKLGMDTALQNDQSINVAWTPEDSARAAGVLGKQATSENIRTGIQNVENDKRKYGAAGLSGVVPIGPLGR